MDNLGKPTFPSLNDKENAVEELDETGSADEAESDNEAESADEAGAVGDDSDEEEYQAVSDDSDSESQTSKPSVSEGQDLEPQLSLDEDSDEDEEDEGYLQKLEKDMQSNFLEDFHPESSMHNYDEVKKLSQVTRDEMGIVVDPLHRTLPFLTKYEKTRILGQRAKQINCGAKPLVQVAPNVLDGYLIAQEELKVKVIPFIIRRPLPGGGFEYWSLKDLDLI